MTITARRLMVIPIVILWPLVALVAGIATTIGCVIMLGSIVGQIWEGTW